MAFRIEKYVSPREVKWCLFVEGKRGSIGKLILELLRGVGSTAVSPHIKSVFVKETFRGCGLGKLLVVTCLGELITGNCQAVKLEAEEDVSRHGKLVKWYQGFGFQVLQREDTKSGSSCQLKYNGDQVFRVEPMICDPSATLVARYIRFQFQSMRFIAAMQSECASEHRWQGTVEECLWKCNEYFGDTVARALSCVKYLREFGEPDFIQLVGLVSYLGRIQEKLQWTCISGSDEPVLQINIDTPAHEDNSPQSDSRSTSNRIATAWLGDVTCHSWVAGYPISEEVPDPEFYALNEDAPSKCGLYPEHCGLFNTQFSWSPWEYLYQVFGHLNNNTLLNSDALGILRYRRFYSWLNSDFYSSLEDDEDVVLKDWVAQVVALLDEFESSFEARNGGEITTQHIRPGECSRTQGSEAFESELAHCREIIDKYTPGTILW